MKCFSLLPFALAVTASLLCGVLSEISILPDPGYLWVPPPCAEDEVRCGLSQCYVPGRGLICHSNQTLCEEVELPCGYWDCYNPGTKECKDGIVCEKSEDVCGYKCVTPSPNKHCLKGTYGFYYCDKDEDACGSWGCFSPREKDCIEDRDVLCKKGEKACGIWAGTGCYDPSAHNCVDNELVPK